jgi:hypothetical protein
MRLESTHNFFGLPWVILDILNANHLPLESK